MMQYDACHMKVDGDMLRERVERRPRVHTRLDPQHPTVEIPPADPTETSIAADARALAKLRIGRPNDAVQLALETGTPIDPFGAYAISPQLGWSHLWVHTGAMLAGSAFGTRISIGGTFGKYRSVMSGPGYEEKPRKGTARLPFGGAFAQVDAELHLARLSPIHYVVSAGLRGGPVHRRYVEHGANKFV